MSENLDLDKIVITNVNAITKKQLQTIAKNKMTTVTALLKPLVNQLIRDTHPAFKVERD